MDQEEVERHRKYDARNNLKLVIKFEANEVEQETFNAWSAEHLPKCGPAMDAMHMRWEFTFTSGSIGNSIVVKCLLCGEEKNITDYSCW
jgi:hypothetical protein